jgi:hypothetical protein
MKGEEEILERLTDTRIIHASYEEWLAKARLRNDQEGYVKALYHLSNAKHDIELLKWVLNER